MQDNKKERVWNDPPFLDDGVQKTSDIDTKQPQKLDLPSRRTKYLFMGAIYLCLGVAIEIGILLGLPLDLLPFALIFCGLIFIFLGLVIFRKDGSSRV